jgi:N-hydroxyarylamine O-acetyltransferase
MSSFSLDAYLGRIEYREHPVPDLDTLAALHLAHAGAIPFENLDIQMGLPIRLDLESLQAKLVQRRRGGYCFEQNTLFLHALREIGFTVIPCEARVRVDTGRVLPRTHMALVVSQGGDDWLADVGFGGEGLVRPVPMDGTPHEQGGLSFRVAREEALHVLQADDGDGWRDQYAFVPEGRYEVDFEVANWFTSTHPESRFVVSLTAQRATPEARHVLRNLTYACRRGTHVESRTIARSELVPLLRGTFGLDVPDDARFRALDG